MSYKPLPDYPSLAFIRNLLKPGVFSGKQAFDHVNPLKCSALKSLQGFPLASITNTLFNIIWSYYWAPSPGSVSESNLYRPFGGPGIEQHAEQYTITVYKIVEEWCALIVRSG